MTNSNSKGDFRQELTNAMLSADIPFWKIENVCFNSFLRKWTGENIPSESTLRKLHLKKCYEEIIRCIKNAIKGQKVWIAMDESIDSCGRSIANFVIGILSNDKEKCKSFVINTESLESTNSTTVIPKSPGFNIQIPRIPIQANN